MQLDNGLQPGIYFNLDSDIYHRDPAISRSDIVNLCDTPNSYWSQSFMNPDRKRRVATDAMEYGEAFHYLLFVPKRFEQLYQVMPIDDWAEHKRKIQYDEYFAMVESIKVLRRGVDSKLFLSGGQPEVTIIFDEGNIRYRTRHDYMTPVVSVDFKTSYSLHEAHIKKDFDRFGYDIQMALYKKARTRFKEQFNAGEAHVYGSIDAKFFDKFIKESVNEFVFIFQRKTAPYPFLPLMPEDDTEASGCNKISKAIKVYQENMSKYGTKPWPVCEGKVKPFSMFYGLREGN